MALSIYNSLAREKQIFEPVRPGRVHMYVCGPTVYNDAHLGHGKTYVNFDIIVRYLRYLGFQVLYVQNITDVGHILDSGEDRILKGAQREQMQPMQLVEHYTRRYFADMDRLNVLRPDISPRATGHIPEMLEWIQRLIDGGHAYVADGSVYFDVSSWESYGKLSGRRLEEAQTGTRVQLADDKRAPEDFALWRKAEPEHIMRWNSPWGVGYPGWHIECTVMSTKYLGQPFDIHGGGVENKFPHHESEIAQAEAAHGEGYARYWVHNGMLMIRGEEMHKSLGNFISLEAAFERWDPMAIRFFILQSHYRGPLDLTEESLDAAARGLERLYGTVRAVRRQLESAPAGEASPETLQMLDTARNAFEASMDDDFGTPGAIAALFDLSRATNVQLGTGLTQGDLMAIDGAFKRLAGDVLGVLPDELGESDAPELSRGLIELLIETRRNLRAARAFDLADQVRDGLGALGVQLQDGPEGTSWTIG
ncbi:MAG: cysteine--tRNA ligase [Anaerolineae bacterium]|jgi:cysteinyl-tRNA synthetase|nr:cysteine--tRNA ligase [Chloroflexota bacterium]